MKGGGRFQGNSKKKDVVSCGFPVGWVPVGFIWVSAGLSVGVLQVSNETNPWGVFVSVGTHQNMLRLASFQAGTNKCERGAQQSLSEHVTKQQVVGNVRFLAMLLRGHWEFN